jgi:hypothetical protein
MSERSLAYFFDLIESKGIFNRRRLASPVAVPPVPDSGKDVLPDTLVQL